MVTQNAPTERFVTGGSLTARNEGPSDQTHRESQDAGAASETKYRIIILEHRDSLNPDIVQDYYLGTQGEGKNPSTELL